MARSDAVVGKSRTHNGETGVHFMRVGIAALAVAGAVSLSTAQAAPIGKMQAPETTQANIGDGLVQQARWWGHRRHGGYGYRSYGYRSYPRNYGFRRW